MGENKFQKVIDVAARCGFAAPEKLQAEIAGLENPQYRVAVVGQFQVGKSTLINRVFLKDHPILLEGIGLPKTAVCTEVEYGEARRLEVYDFEGKLVSAVDDPGKSDVEKFTVGADRKKLAKEVARVRITEPNESLKSYTVIDTPGIDDPEPELLIDTTYRVIPGADLAILMVEPRMMDTIETDLLRRLSGDGVSKVMVLVSFDPAKDKQNNERRQDIIEVIKAQLAEIKRTDIPVDIFCFDESVENTLNTPEKIEKRLAAFLEVSARAGREARIAAHVKDFLGECLNGLAARIAAAEKSEAEKAELLAKLADRRAELSKQCDRLELDLDNDFDRLARKMALKVRMELDDLLKKYKADIENASSIEAIQKIVDGMKDHLSLDLVEKTDKHSIEIMNEIKLALARRMPQKTDFGVEWNVFWNNELPEIDPGFLAKIPNWVYEILNIILGDFVLPGGIITATIVRLIQNIIPVLKDLTLQKLALVLMKPKVTAAIDAAFGEIKNDIDGKYSAGFANVATAVKKELRSYFAAQLDAIEAGINDGKAEDKAALLNAKAEIEAAIAAL